MKTGNFIALKVILDEMVQEMRIGGKLNEIKIKKIWFEQMQGVIAKNTKHVFYRNKKLYINIESSVIKQELFMAKEKICQIINDKLGEQLIDEVIIN